MDADSGDRVRVSPRRAHCATKESMMTSTREQIAPHMARFLVMLDAAFRRYGVSDGLPERFRNAVTATPRHMFVHRFRMSGGPLRDRIDEGAVRDNDADPVRELADIYSDAVMIHVDASGERLPSTNFQPSYVLWLLDLLDLRPGQRVLEIGSGSGSLVAVMARLVGNGGHVTGMEIIPELAAQSQADLRRLGIDNVSVLAADGAEGHSAGAPFDRVMITAATWDLPAVLFDQVAEGGRVLMPVELRGGGCQVTVLRREGERFVGERAVPGGFVPLRGSGQQRPALRVALAELPFWDEIGRLPPRRVPLPLAMGLPRSRWGWTLWLGVP
jgi:protein-L-isoaspartate(D-aspartate) O-methyltransferase